MDAKFDSLERITLQMTSSLQLQEVLTSITQGLVDELEAAFARIWLLGPGDLCDSCHKAPHCRNRECCLHLEASAGLYTSLDGEYRRIPLGALKIGRIAQGEGPMYTSDVLGDDRLPNKAWMREMGLRSFAGYPLIFRDEVLGVMSMFSRRVMTEKEFDQLAIFANQAAIAIQNARLFSEVQSLKNRLQAENRYLTEEIESGHDFSEIIGQSQSLQKVLSKVKQVAPTEASVLINGETGTGKELIARAIHNLGPRKSRPLIKVNCAALPPGLIESELFGHEKGAFTGALARRIGRFELADGGTIFLDEVGDLPMELQSKLLRVLQEQELERVGGTQTIKVNTRVIAATHRNLEEAIKREQFRADLYYRLNVFPVKMPSLGERKEDIAVLARYFVQKKSAAMGKRIDNISRSVMDKLEGYDWPGNIRELENVIERAVILTTGRELQLDETFEAAAVAEPESDGGSTTTLEEVEREHILRVLESTNWVIEGNRGAAAPLGLNPSTLRSRMEKLDIKKHKR